MVDRSDVAGLNAFDLLDTESERVARHFDSLDEDGWAADTRCEGWRSRELLAHLAGVETYHLACLDDAIPVLMEAATASGVTDVHSFNDWAVRIRADKERSDVYDEWRAKNTEVRKRMRDLGPEAEMSSMVGPYPVDLMAFHVASEYATHADDMAGLLDDAGRTGWRAKVSKFAIKETEKPLEVSEEGDTVLVRGDGKEAKLPVADFVEAVTSRLPKDYPIDATLREQLISLA